MTTKKFLKLWISFVTISTVLILMVWFIAASIPMDEQIKKNFNEKQQLIEQDLANMLYFEDANIDIAKDEISINIKDDNSELKLVYDKELNLLTKVIKDYRFGHSGVIELIGCITLLGILVPTVISVVIAIFIDDYKYQKSEENL